MGSPEVISGYMKFSSRLSPFDLLKAEKNEIVDLKEQPGG
jgi:hypothetical protein